MGEHDAICNLLIDRWPLPQPYPSVADVMDKAMKDSKRGITGEEDGEISDVLCRRVGDVVPSNTQMLNKFSRSLFEGWFESMGFPKDTVGEKAGRQCAA